MRLTLGKTLRCLTAAAVMVGLASCVTDEGGPGLNLSVNLFGSDDSKRYPVRPRKFPFHVKATIAAAVARLRGVSPGQVTQDIGVAGSDIISPEQGFDYSDFAVKNIELLKLETPEGRSLARNIAGFVHFEDATNRHAAVDFEISYQIGGKHPVFITEATVAPAFPRGAEAAMYILPAKAAEAGLPKVKDYTDLYRLVRASSVPMHQAAASPRAGDYVIVVFFLDRLPRGDKVQVGVSSIRKGPNSFTGATRYLAFKDGWVAALIPGNFARGPNKPFWIKAVHSAASGTYLGAKPEVVGLFSTDPTTEPTS